MKMGVD